MPEQKKSRKFIRNDKLIRPECRVKKSQHNLELESFRQLFLSHCFPFLGLVPICQLRGFENIFETSHSLVDSFLCFYRATIKRHCSTQIDKSSRTLGEQNRWQNRPCVTFGPAALCLHPLIANPIKHHRQHHPTSRLPTDPPTFFDRRKFASSLTTTATFRGIIVNIQFCLLRILHNAKTYNVNKSGRRHFASA
jgi:hypothetical protein